MDACLQVRKGCGGSQGKGVCSSCGAGQYQVTSTRCADCDRDCDGNQGMYESSPCGQTIAGSPLRNRNCSMCSSRTCRPGTVLTGCGWKLAGACLDCPPGTYAAGTMYRTECTTCDKECSAGEYLKNCAGSFEGECDVCPLGTYATYAGVRTQCSTCTQCAPGKYTSKQCSATSDSDCAACTVCVDGAFLSGCMPEGRTPGMCVSVYVCTYMHAVYMHMIIFTCIHTHTHECISRSTLYSYIHTHPHMYIHICIYIYIYIYIRTPGTCKTCPQYGTPRMPLCYEAMGTGSSRSSVRVSVDNAQVRAAASPVHPSFGRTLAAIGDVDGESHICMSTCMYLCHRLTALWRL